MSMFTLAISCLPWFMDLTFQVPMQYCSLQHWTYSITRHIHNWALFLLWLCLFILSGVISPLISSSILGTYWPREFIFPCPISLPFLYYSWGSQGKNTEEVCHCLLHILSELSTMIRPSWVALHGMAHSCIGLDKAVVPVIRLVSFLWLWFLVCLPSDGEG